MSPWIRWRRVLARPAAAYALAVALSAVAFAARPVVGEHLGRDPVLVLALPVVVVSAWAGGLGPGVLAVLLMVLGRLAWALFEGHAALDSAYFLRAAIAVPSALMVCLAFEQVRRARHRAEARAETELRAQERLRRLVDSSAVAIAFSSKGVITEANQTFLTLLGYTRDDLQAGRINQATLVPESERPVYRMAKQELDETGRNGPFHAVLRRPDGILVDVITSAGKLGEDDYCIFFTNITALTRAERALRISEERFRSLVNATASIVWTAGPQREFLTAQPSWAEYTGQSPEQYLGFGWLQALHPDDRAQAMEGWREAERLQQPFRGRTRLWHHASQGYRRVVARANPVLRDGQIAEWVGMVFDIEEGEQVSERLREASERLQLLVENTPLAVIEFDGELHITRWAGQAEALFGWTAGEALGQRAAALGWALPEEVMGPRKLRELLRGDTPRTRFRIRNQRKDGRIVHAEWSISALRPPEQGRASALLALVLDVTEREQALEQLKQADRQKDDFIATLAHELRNPLAPIANGARLLSLKPDDVKTVGWAAQAIERQVRQLTRLLDDLLDVSRISRNVLHLQRQRMRLQDAIELAAEQVRPFLETQGHRLQLRVAPEPMPLMGDVARLAQVFANLLHNAAKYTPQPGLITLQAGWRDAQWLEVSVQDPGLGIPAHEQRRVFEMFSQAHPDLRSAQPGLGIGLALVKGIVEIHGGTVGVHSEGAGRGSRFTVALPALSGGEESLPLASAAPGLAGVAGYRILVVDDNTDSAESIAALMAQCGNSVRSAFNAQAALEQGAAFHPAVVLMDIGMPGIDGLQAARMMRDTSWGRAAVLIAMTGYGQPEDKRRALQAGFDHHLTKPVDLDALARCLAGP
ncbi:MAG: PAS domain S-box protein [Pseudomonadota bacterium]